MNKREFCNRLVTALRIDGYYMSHTNSDAYGKPYQVTVSDPVGDFSTRSAINYVVRCHKNIVSIYKYTNKGALKLDDNLKLLKQTDWNTGYKPNMLALTVDQLKKYVETV